MYSLVRRYLKTAIGFLALGLAIGAWIIVRRELFGAAPPEHAVSAHAHAILVGFVMLLIQGVALWLRWGVVLSAFAQIAGLGVYFYTMWSRIRPVGSALREAKGERF